MTVSQNAVSVLNPVLLEKIDKLRDWNVGHHVPLPQLVVVGDQSSGKSSLLESLSGIPFPKDQNLCTRYATQITSKRESEDGVQISITPGPHASDEHKDQLKGFHRHLSSGSEFRKQFTDILKKANEKMGLRTDLATDIGAVFSEDVLKIEISGPREDYLTIIDVPGIFRNVVQGTTKDDMTLVRGMVERYIKDDRTIILAVLPSNVDIATQEILTLAEDYDKIGERTLGVLTKPDLVLEPSAQAAVRNLVLGNKRPLSLGYFLVRNRGADGGVEELSELDREFQKQQWVDLPRDRVGIAALKDQLKSLLVDITKREFPKLIKDINEQSKECKKELDSLGPPRQHEREQRIFLSQIAGNFQKRVREALDAHYNADPVFKQDEFRLITHVVNITDVFSADFRETAHSRHFEDLRLLKPNVTDEKVDGSPPDCNCKENSAGLMIDHLRVLLEKAKVDDIAPGEYSELGDIIIPLEEISKPGDNFTTWMNDVYLQSRGLDLGTFEPHLLSMAFTEQSRKWGDMTKTYMRRIIIALHRFIAAALRSVCLEDQARSHLWSAILEELLKRYKVAMAQASLLIEVEQRKQPYTLNPQFNQAWSKATGYRITELLRPTAKKESKQYGVVQYMVNLDDIAKAAEGKRNVEKVQEDIHDILQAYYSLATERFIDNVFHLAVDHCLLHGPDSPLQVFNQDWVISLEPEQLERIVGETKSAKGRRSALMKKLNELSHALKILKS
ncbi:dynamin family protein [Trichoderma gamsii]|uniref:Dynamin family protein n=1 Tax=Trichoderma gamsii TaxID=398673 RepID=A0A2P4ZN84_9HYPO|nr:dynamin family protein [Trichoderma gamsii]PON25743.1 dynamin family protein [Trichoderma gamsii]